MKTEIKKYDRVKFEMFAGGKKIEVRATAASSIYLNEDAEEVIDLDCDGWKTTFRGTTIEGIEKLE